MRAESRCETGTLALCRARPDGQLVRRGLGTYEGELQVVGVLADTGVRIDVGFGLWIREE